MSSSERTVTLVSLSVAFLSVGVNGVLTFQANRTAERAAEADEKARGDDLGRMLFEHQFAGYLELEQKLAQIEEARVQDRAAIHAAREDFLRTTRRLALYLPAPVVAKAQEFNNANFDPVIDRAVPNVCGMLDLSPDESRRLMSGLLAREELRDAIREELRVGAISSRVRQTLPQDGEGPSEGTRILEGTLRAMDQ